MKAAKDIDEIYDEIKNYDIVLSNDAALVTALNNRINAPRIGRLASTPKMIAKDHEDAVLGPLMMSGKCTDDGKYGIMDDVRLLERVSDETGYDIRFVHGEIENIRQIRKYTRDVEKYLFGAPSKKIYKAFSELPTYELVMSSFDTSDHDVYRGKKTAVIGLDLFDDLDKHFIPADFDEIDIFRKDGEYFIDRVHAVGNDRQVAENAVDLITKENAEDVAIVMDSEGQIADAVRSALYRKGIGFKNTMNAKDIVNLRDYLEFIRKALSYDILTVGDVRELYACYGPAVSDKNDEYLLDRYARIPTESISGKSFRELSDIMKNIRDHTFSEVCTKIVDSRYRGTVMMILDGLGISDRHIDERSEASISYLVRSMDGIKHNAEIPDSEKKGVLLADCKNSMFIDRPLVMFLGIDGSWSSRDPGKDYIDRDTEEEKEIQRFQVLLQQGSSRIHIVNTMKNGKEARPCVLFDRINVNDDGTPVRIGSFRDIVGTEIKKGAWLPSAVPADVTKEHCPNTSSHKMGDLSKTSMNMYVSCPRAYMFSELVVTPDSENTVFGNMIHEFAEFCACYPKIAKENIDECVRMISDVYAGISCPERKEFDLSRITSAVTNVEKFIDLLNVSVPLNVDARSKKHMNRFFERFGLTMTSDIVECDRRSSKYPMHGGFDLLIGNKVIDHKSGRMPKTSEIIDKMEISEKKDHFEFQPLVYLSILDDILERPGEREFVLFYAAGNETDLSGSFDVMKNTRNVTLLNMHKPDIIKSGMLLDIVTEAKSKEFIRDIGEGFNNALLEAGIDNAESWKNDETLIERIIALQSKRTKAVTDAIRSAVKKAGEIMSGCYINDGSRILIPRETIEQFKEYAKKIHARADGQQITGFPYEPRISCDRCVFFHICTGGRPDDA